MILSDYLENKLLDHLLKATAYTRPATLYFGLYTSAPSDSGGGVEPAAASYARSAVTNDSTNFPNCAITGNPIKANATIISFPTAESSWGTITHWGIFDAATSGNLLAWGSFTSSRSVATGDSPKLAAGTISITVTNTAGGGLTNFAKRQLLDHTFGGPNYTPPTTIYSTLGTALTGETLTEYADTGFARPATAFGSASSGQSLNSSIEDFTLGVSATGAATLTHFAIFDDLTAGNLLAVGPLSVSRAVVESDSISMAVSGFSVTFQ